MDKKGLKESKKRLKEKTSYLSMCKNIIKLFIEEVEDKITYNSHMDSYYAEVNEIQKRKLMTC